MRELIVDEIDLVSGGNNPGYSRDDGSAFTWIGPNGMAYNNVTFVGTHFFVMDGFQEYFADYFAAPSYSLETFLNTMSGSGLSFALRYW